jgi:hypothetical protein
MHDALRAQHPECFEADGKSPTCDYYESLFTRLLVSCRAHDGAQPRSDIQRSYVPASQGQGTVRYVHAPFSLSNGGAAFSS